MDQNENGVLERSAQMRGTQRRWRSYPPSLVWPVVLITLGIVLLLKNVGSLNEVTWNTILHLWPLLLVALGLESLLRRQGVVAPVFWIVLGVVFLFSEMGWANWDALQIAIKFWPLLLVAIGLDFILPRRTLWASIGALIILLGIFAGALWFMGVRILIH
jgi:hypothetical protein